MANVLNRIVPVIPTGQIMRGLACRRPSVGGKTRLIVRLPFLVWKGEFYRIELDQTLNDWHIKWLYMSFEFAVCTEAVHG